MWFSFNLSSPLRWYTVHIVFVFNFCFSSLLVLLIDMKEKKRKHALATQPIGCKWKTNQIMITWGTFPRFSLHRYTVDYVKAMNRALFSWKILSRLLLNVIAPRDSLFDKDDKFIKAWIMKPYFYKLNATVWTRSWKQDKACKDREILFRFNSRSLGIH